MTNIFSIGVVQACNLIIPLLLIPFLVSIYGIDGYGKIAFVHLLAFFSNLLIEYGYNIGGVQRVSSQRRDKAQLSRTIANILGVQLFLLVVSLSAITLFLKYFNGMAEYKTAATFIYILIIGNCLFPLWLFQGLEKMKSAACFQLLNKVIFVASVVFFITDSKNIENVVLIQGICAVLTSFISLIFIYRQKLFILDLSNISRNNFQNELVEGFSFFVSKIAITSYTSLLSFSVGYFMGPAALGAYTIADKVRGASQAFLIPISQAILPRISNLVGMENKKAEVARILKFSLTAILIISIAISTGLFAFANEIVVFFSNNLNTETVQLTRIMCFIVIAVGISNWAGIQVMVPLGHSRGFKNIIVIVATLCITMIYPIVINYGVVGVSWLYLFCEFLVAIWMIIFLIRKGIIRSLYRNELIK